ncbi:copper-containing nitrite reductase [Neptunomonas sp.]|uniref:copper-containing nitrite reductase n=1 Tax=Neptunomonas sp. TaxID=1971898 RepID=UPI003563614F
MTNMSNEFSDHAARLADNNETKSSDSGLSGISRRGFIGSSIAAVGAIALTGQSQAASHKSATSYAAAMDVAGLDIVEQQLVTPPFLPVHDQVAPKQPRLVKVRLVIEEKQITLAASGEKIWACTFNGSVPGPMIVCHENDYVEVTLINPATNTLPHNIDFHAATGAMGGGTLTEVAPGQETILRFKATKAGVFVYHCAPGGVMIPFHVVTGMNGAIMVLPRDGLKDKHGEPAHYDRAYYVGEQDFYLPKDAQGKYKLYDSVMASMGDMLDVMRTLTPSHVVFNGAVGALTGDNALKAKVGENVLIIHSQANRDSRPHLIGGHGDLVWQSGSFHDTPQSNIETWFIAGGSAGAALYTFRQPGTYAYVSHNLIEAIMLGAAAHFSVEGEWNEDLMKQVKAPSPIS